MSTSPTASEKNVGGDPDWRASFPQSKRNAEARALAKELASLEPGASEASKLRLATQVEDVVFKQATSEADYRKRLTKRLNKVKKSYRPAVVNNTQKKEAIIQELRVKYGDSLTYIAKHAAKAVSETRARQGEANAAGIKQNTDAAIQWAKELGLLPGTTPNYNISDSSLEKIQNHLQNHLASIRRGTVRMVEPDKFLREKLERTEEEFKDKSAAVKLQSDVIRRRYAQLRQLSPDEIDSNAMLTEALEQATKPVPIAQQTSTTTTAQIFRRIRKASDPNEREKAALIHLDKMRAASTVMLAYLLASDKYSVPRNTLAKAHDVAVEGIGFVATVIKEVRQKQSEDTAEVELQDAWLKALVLPIDDDNERSTTTTSAAAALRSRVLLTAGRKTPGTLVPVLQSKGAKLIRPPPTGAGSHLEIEFGEAFVMTIYLVPLLVTLRAYQKKDDEKDADDDDNDDEEGTMDRWKCASWTPLHHGLQDRELIVVGGAVKGTYGTVGLAVQERLRDASAQATLVLRKCFAASGAATGSEFEIEILEASALLEFVTLARTTFTPNWTDKGGA